jgi:Tfp pilus assembly protein PilX
MRNQRGVALLTSLLIVAAMMIMGLGAITVSGLGNKMAGYSRTGESSANAAESCVSTAIKLIQDTIDGGVVPAAYLDNAVPAGPVPTANGPTLQQEILGQLDNHTDVATNAPNTQVLVNGYMVQGDIDRLYASPRAGSAIQFAGGYEGVGGGASAGGVDIVYRVDCTARNTATATTSRIVAVYACTLSGDSCQRRP